MLAFHTLPPSPDPIDPALRLENLPPLDWEKTWGKILLLPPVGSACLVDAMDEGGAKAALKVGQGDGVGFVGLEEFRRSSQAAGIHGGLVAPVFLRSRRFHLIGLCWGWG
jgi:hypothetical protein